MVHCPITLVSVIAGTRSSCCVACPRRRNLWKIEPQMSAVVVLTEYDFTVGTGDGISEPVAIAALLQHRHLQLQDWSGCLTRDHSRTDSPSPFRKSQKSCRPQSPRSVRPARDALCQANGSPCPRQIRKAPRSIGGEHEPRVTIASPRQRNGPVAVREVNGIASDAAGSKIEAPKPRSIILSENPAAIHDELTATRRFSHDSNTSRFEIDGKQVPRRDTYDGISAGAATA